MTLRLRGVVRYGITSSVPLFVSYFTEWAPSPEWRSTSTGNTEYTRAIGGNPRWWKSIEGIALSAMSYSTAECNNQVGSCRVSSSQALRGRKTADMQSYPTVGRLGPELLAVEDLTCSSRLMMQTRTLDIFPFSVHWTIEWQQPFTSIAEPTPVLLRIRIHVLDGDDDDEME